MLFSNKRKIFSIKVFYILLILTLASSNLYAKPFSTLLEKILKQDESINSSKILIEKAKNDLSSTNSLYTPKLDFTLPFGRELLINNDTPNTDLDFYEFNAKLTQNIYDFGLTSSKYEKAENKLKLAKVSRQNVKTNKIYEALVAYFNYIKSYKILQFAQQSEARIREVSNLENEKVARGAGLASNVLQSKAKLAGAKSTRVRFQGDLEVAKNRFYNIFRELPQDYKSFKLPKPPLNLLPSSEEEAIKIAKKNNIALKLSKINLENAKSSIKTSKAKFFPSLKASAEYKNKRNLSGIDGTEIDHIYKIEMKYPISIGGPYGLFFKENADYKSSMNQYMMAKYSYDQMERNLEESVRNAWQTKRSSKENFEYLENQANISGEFFDIAMKEVKLGNRQLIDILSSETAFINAKSAAEVAFTDYQLSTYQLLLSIGILDERIFKQVNSNIKEEEKISKKKINKSKIIKKENKQEKVTIGNEKLKKSVKKVSKIKIKKPFKQLNKNNEKKIKDSIKNITSYKNNKFNKPISIINEDEFISDKIDIINDDNKNNDKEMNDKPSEKISKNIILKSQFKIQLGAFSNVKNAERLMRLINADNINQIQLGIVKGNENSYFKVLSINSYDRNKAKDICKQFASNTYNCIITKK